MTSFPFCLRDFARSVNAAVLDGLIASTFGLKSFISLTFDSIYYHYLN